MAFEKQATAILMVTHIETSARVTRRNNVKAIAMLVLAARIGAPQTVKLLTRIGLKHRALKETGPVHWGKPRPSPKFSNWKQRAAEWESDPHRQLRTLPSTQKSLCQETCVAQLLSNGYATHAHKINRRIYSNSGGKRYPHATTRLNKVS